MNEQPAPTGNGERVTPEARRLFLEILERQSAKGVAEYGTPLRAHNGRDALLDALEELVDAFQYVTQARIERGAPSMSARDGGTSADLVMLTPIQYAALVPREDYDRLERECAAAEARAWRAERWMVAWRRLACVRKAAEIRAAHAELKLLEDEDMLAQPRGVGEDT